MQKAGGRVRPSPRLPFPPFIHVLRGRNRFSARRIPLPLWAVFRNPAVTPH